MRSKYPTMFSKLGFTMVKTILNAISNIASQQALKTCGTEKVKKQRFFILKISHNCGLIYFSQKIVFRTVLNKMAH